MRFLYPFFRSRGHIRVRPTLDRRRSDLAPVSPRAPTATQHGSPTGSAMSIHSTQNALPSEQQHPPASRSALHISLSQPDASSITTLSVSSLSPGIQPGGGGVGSPHTTSASLGSSTAVESSPSLPPSSALGALALSGVDDLRSGGGGSPPSFKDLHPGNFAPMHESRRRNAEQREAALRADSLLKEVEPNKVFCGLCEKWVQLRQDSSFCAYPWVQHRQKCVARQ